MGVVSFVFELKPGIDEIALLPTDFIKPSILEMILYMNAFSNYFFIHIF